MATAPEVSRTRTVLSCQHEDCTQTAGTGERETGDTAFSLESSHIKHLKKQLTLKGSIDGIKNVKCDNGMFFSELSGFAHFKVQICSLKYSEVVTHMHTAPHKRAEGCSVRGSCRTLQ